MTKQWGATPDDWVSFDLFHGLGRDLLPVVSNPEAVISPNSKMKGVGKTPSRYNRAREVAGFPTWTKHVTTPGELAKWSREPDYGICLQTRYVRAFDIDVEDVDRAAAIHNFIDNFLGFEAPCRHRNNSGKRLLAVAIPGDIPKRKMDVAGGIVEFLGTGQQFVAAGTHTSGVPYEWTWPGARETFTEIDLATLDRLWSALAEAFALSAPTQGTLRRGRVDTPADLPHDATLDWLGDNGLVHSYGPEQQAFITCPFEAMHTQDSGESSTAYFPKGTRGYDQGHFVCLHAHCQHRTDHDFLDALGVIRDDFLPVEAESAAPGEKPWPRFQRNKDGEILALVNNIQAALRRPDITGWQIQYDEFRGEIMIARADSERAWRPLTDTDYFMLRMRLEALGFKPVGRELIRDAIGFVAERQPFDSAIEWLSGLTWDGVPRVASFMPEYMRAANDDYTQAVGLYLWTALAGRVLQPGVKADMVPIFEGLQGVGKSSVVAAISPSEEFFCEISFHEKDADLARMMKGCLVAEIGELRGLHTRELEGIKAFISRTHEKWVPKYRELPIMYPRRLVFIGTTNQDELLADETGNRRWLPANVGECAIDRLREDRAQLWAEGAALFARHGVMWRDAQRLAAGVHADYQVRSTFEDAIERWLHEEGVDGATPAQRAYVTVHEVARDALFLDVARTTRAHEMKIATALQNLGCKKGRVGDSRRRVYFLPNGADLF